MKTGYMKQTEWKTLWQRAIQLKDELLVEAQVREQRQRLQADVADDLRWPLKSKRPRKAQEGLLS